MRVEQGELRTTRGMRRELPCPGCGYDLRGTAVVEGMRRCSECGQSTEKSAAKRASTIPWTHRRTRGRVSAYIRTLFWYVLNFSKLPREIERPAVLRDAKLFYRISLLFAMVQLAALTFVLYKLLDVNFSISFEHIPLPLLPPIVLIDGWWGPLIGACGIWLGMHLAMTVVRPLLVIGTIHRVRRARLWRASLYFSAVLPLLVAGLGLMAVVNAVIEQSHVFWFSRHRDFVVWAMGLLWVYVLVVLYVPAIGAISNVGGFKWWRGAAVVVVMPVAIVGITAATAFIIMWVVGYVALAVQSMTS